MPVTLEQFAQEATAFLEDHAARKSAGGPFVWGVGDDRVGLFEEIDPEAERRGLAEAKRWRAARYDAGLGWITGPARYGGRELSGAHEQLYTRLESAYVVPSGTYFGVGLGMVVPTIVAHGQEPARERYLPGLHRGDIVACQLFSEPGAGSDLASLSARAVRDGDEWVVSGQKVWTSGAHFSDIGEILVRTDPDQPKHRGLTAFLLDMGVPGVEIRPLRQMTGGASFNEVFLTEARIPDDHRLGDVNGGWAVALTTLMNERMSIGTTGGGGLGLADGRRLIEMLRHFGLERDRTYRDELMALYTGFSVARWTNQRAIDRLKAGQLPGPELSIAKLSLTRNLDALSRFAARVLGPRLTADTGEWGTFAWNGMVLGAPGMRIAGGTDEVMRNIVAERVLGLPKDPGIDTKSPFRR